MLVDDDHNHVAWNCAAFVSAGAVAEGAAGSMIQTATRLSCTLDPNVIKDNSGGGADCSFATDQ